jgi:hypothetical protein
MYISKVLYASWANDDDIELAMDTGAVSATALGPIDVRVLATAAACVKDLDWGRENGGGGRQTLEAFAVVPKSPM